MQSNGRIPSTSLSTCLQMMAKLACGLNKPNKQTVLPLCHQGDLFTGLKLSKLRGLGGKLGDSVREDLHCHTVGDLAQLSLASIRLHFDEKTARWLHDVARYYALSSV